MSRRIHVENISLGILIALTLSACNGYVKEGDAVYYKYWNEGSGGHKFILPGVKADRFTILKYDNYAKDDNKVFYKGNPIIGADAPTFESIGEFYARDKYQGYKGGREIEGSYGPAFKAIDGYYTTDGRKVFFDREALDMVDASKFRYVFDDEDGFSRWATDGKHYYHQSFKVPSEDYKNITVYKKSGGLAKDSQWVYFLDHKLNYDIDGKMVVDTIDVKSFTVTGFIECHDKFGCFNVYHGREKCNAQY